MRKLVSVKEIEKFPLYDITVENDHCFELVNGVIAHNSMYPKAIVSGGCVVAGTEIQTPDGLKKVEDFEPGDIVITKMGPKEVTHVWNPETLLEGEPECYEIVFEDGHSVICSFKHKFIVDGRWIEAKDLAENMDCEIVDQDQFKKISTIKKMGQLPVYDLSVKDAEHYVLKNGVVTHNTGIYYSANQIFIISKSQEKDGTELAGFKFTINIEKSRYVKEKSKLPFSVFFDSGIQKWSSLFELAQESGHIIKPKVGWYQTVDMETGEISDKSYRAKDLEDNDEYFEKLVKDKVFKDYVERKFKLTGGTSSNQVETDEYEEVDIDE